MNPSEPSKLDEKLRQLAATNWDAFVRLVGPEVIDRAKVCLLRSEQKSFRFIAHKLHISKGKVETSCRKCPVE